MPRTPPGERQLQLHAARFIKAESFIVTMLYEAGQHNPPQALRDAGNHLLALRKLDHRAPVVAAYLYEHPKGSPGAVRVLAGSLAKRLDTGIKTTMDSIRSTFPKVVDSSVTEEMAAAAVIAAVDRGGQSWSLGRWAEMNCDTIGRKATSLGTADNVGQGATVTIEVGECEYCAQFAGPAVIGQDPLPPYHPSCTCIASRA